MVKLNFKNEDWKVLQNSVGWKIHREIGVLKAYKNIMDVNFSDLIQKIGYYEENWSDIWNMKSSTFKRDNLDIFMNDCLRLLHNYLMSSKSLKNKTIGFRNHIKKNYEERDISQEDYNKMSNELNLDEQDKIITSLRNNFAHRTSLEGIKRIAFNLNRKRGDKEWNARISLSDSDLEIRIILSDHYKAVGKFHSWFITTIEDNFSKEIENTERLAKKMRIQLL